MEEGGREDGEHEGVACPNDSDLELVVASRLRVRTSLLSPFSASHPPFP